MSTFLYIVGFKNKPNMPSSRWQVCKRQIIIGFISVLGISALAGFVIGIIVSNTDLGEYDTYKYLY